MQKDRTDNLPVAASQTDYQLGNSAKDVLERLIISVATAATSTVSLKDGSGSAIPIMPANTPIGVYTVRLGARGVDAGGWKITTGAGVTVLAIGDFAIPDGGVTPPPPPPPAILLDNFDDVDGTALELHSLDTDAGSGWHKAGSSAEIQGNVLVGMAANTDPVYVVDGGVGEGTLEFDLVLDTTDTQVNMYLGTNVSGSAAAGYIVICYPLSGIIQIFRSGEGVGGVVAQQTGITFTPGAQTFKSILTATDLSFYIDNVMKLTSPVNVVSSTFFGFEIYHPGGTPGTTLGRFELTA